MRLWFFLLFCATTKAGLIDLSQVDLKRESYSLKKVCSYMGHNHQLMVDAQNTQFVDCMGEMVSVQDFCQKVSKKDLNLSRGFINSNMSLAYCDYASSVKIKFSCEKKQAKYCSSSAKKGCQKLGKFYARDHQLIHQTFIDENPPLLSCLFSQNLE